MSSRFTPSRPASRVGQTASPVIPPVQHVQRPPNRDRDSQINTDRPLNLSGFMKRPGTGKLPGTGAASRAKVLQQMKPRPSDASDDAFKVPSLASPSIASSRGQDHEETFAYMTGTRVRDPHPTSDPSLLLDKQRDAREHLDDSGYFSGDNFFRTESDLDPQAPVSYSLPDLSSAHILSQVAHIGSRSHQDTQVIFHESHPLSQSSHDAPIPVVDDDDIRKQIPLKHAREYHERDSLSRESKRRRSGQPSQSFFSMAASKTDSTASISANPMAEETQRASDIFSGVLSGIEHSTEQTNHLHAFHQSCFHRWEEATIEDWRREADTLQKDFADILSIVLKQMTGKMKLYSDLKSHVTERQDVLGQRDADLKAAQLSLVRESGNVGRSCSPIDAL